MSTTAASVALALFAVLVSPCAAQESRLDEIARAIEESRVERAAGRLAEAENLLRAALRTGWSAQLGVELGGVLTERASALDGSSELMRSLRDGTIAEALAVFTHAAEDDATAVDATLGCATCHVLAGEIDLADATLAARLVKLRESAAPVASRRRLVQERVRLLASNDRSGPAREQIAQAKTAGELDAAAAAYEELAVTTATPDDAAIATAAVAAIAAGAEAFDVAFVCWDAIGPTSPEKLERLLHLYSKLLEGRPMATPLLFYRGVVRSMMGDAAGALEDLHPCLEDPRVGDQATLRYGYALVRVKRAEEALGHFESLVKKRSGFTHLALNGYVDVAISRVRERRHADALVLYQAVIAKEPTNGFARIGEPLCLRTLGDYEKAAAAYEAGIAAMRDDPGTQSQLLNDYALMLRARGDRERARELFEEALGASSADAGENLGTFAMRDGGDPELAARYFARTLLLDSKRPRVRFYRELCLAAGSAKPPK